MPNGAQPNSDAKDPGKVLHGGEFYSPVQARLRTRDIVLSELRQPCSRAVPRHEHELAYVTVVLHGDYLEGDRRLDELRPFTAVFNPAGIAHSTVIGPEGASFFTIELKEGNLRHLGINLPSCTTFDRGAGAMLWPGLRLYSAFKTQAVSQAGNRADDALPSCEVLLDDIIEAHVLELLGAISGLESADSESRGVEAYRKSSLENSAPRWFRQVKERLHEDFREPLRIRDLARDAGVHPVHLARVFRKLENRTPGDYQQRLQVRAACELLRKPEWPLAVIAAECGFADQSHFTRVFRRMAGTTPAKFRKVVAPQVSAA
jgi:AraC family transcriptional regulator